MFIKCTISSVTTSVKMQHFEIYLLTDQISQASWLDFFRAVAQYSGLFAKFEVTFRCTDNVVRFFISSNKDLSGLSNNIEGMILRPVAEEELKTPRAPSTERMVKFVQGGNLLDLKEKYVVRKGKDLEYAKFSIRSLGQQKAITNSVLYFKSKAGQWSKAGKTIYYFPLNLLAVDFSVNTHYLKKSSPRYLNLEKSLHILVSDKHDALFEVDTFPYFSHNYYLNLTNYEFDRHSFILGASGSGKSKFISLLVDRLSRTSLKMNYRVVVIDPHNSLAEDFTHLEDAKVINFSSESAELFSGSESDVTAATELTATLFKSLLGEQFNPKLDRVLRFSLFVLFTAQNMALENLKRFLTDIDLRNQVLDHVSGYVPANIVKFFGSDFNELRTKYYNESILPLVSLVDEMQMQPTLVSEGELSLNKTINDHFLTVFSLNKVSMGEKVVKTVAGLLIQQIFLLAQARAFGQKVILIIDEVSVVQNPALASILAEARKFNLSVILAQQYFGQVEKDLRDAIFANVFNYYCFKVSEEDARALAGNLNMELPSSIVEEENARGLKEEDLRVKIMSELHPRECLVRVLANGQVVPCIKARTLDAPRPAKTTKEAQLKTYKQAKLPTKFEEKSSAATQPQTLETASAPGPAAASPSPKPKSGKQPHKVASSFVLSHANTGSIRENPLPLQPQTFNLSDLLAQHSSSRLDMHKRKEKT
jgi:hypothetical protein